MTPVRLVRSLPRCAALAALLACVALAPASAAPPPRQPAAPPSLEGQWEVTGATYQLGGTSLYEFRGNTLTIVQSVGGKDGGPLKRLTSKHTFEIDTTERPYLLVVSSIPAPGKTATTRTEAIELRNGELRLTRAPGWVTTLRKLEQQK
jgi:hypothetical protein